jgi:hypothetical protein
LTFAVDLGEQSSHHFFGRGRQCAFLKFKHVPQRHIHQKAQQFHPDTFAALSAKSGLHLGGHLLEEWPEDTLTVRIIQPVA